MHLYLSESAAKIGLSSNRITVRSTTDNTIIQDFPFDDVEGISIFGNPQLSTYLLRKCLEKSLPVSFYSEDGHYFGHLSSCDHVDPSKQRLQVLLSEDPSFRIGWAKNIVSAKISNSLAFLKSYSQEHPFDTQELYGLEHSLKNINDAETVEQILGFEGNAAKSYFSCLSTLIDNQQFAFRGRSARPPRDPFNSMLSFGYSMVYRNIIGAINAVGLNPYFAFLHTSSQGHAALASDLIEEWRAWIVDRTVLDFVNNENITNCNFYATDSGAVYMQKETMRLLTHRLGDAMVRKEAFFLSCQDPKQYGFQVALRKKVLLLNEAIEKRDPYVYKPFIVREQPN